MLKELKKNRVSCVVVSILFTSATFDFTLS